MNNLRKNNLKKLLVTVGILILLNVIGNLYFKRFDLTGDKRYTLSPVSLKILKDVEEPLYVDVFLEGEFPGEFQRLQTETRQLLEEFKAYNKNIVFEFVNPLEKEEERDSILQSFTEKGLTPISVTLDDKGKQTQAVVFPWAIATYKNKSVKIPLLKNLMGASTQEKVVSSVQHLEYAFANGFNTVSKAKTKKVAVIKGNGEIHDLLMADFIKQVREQYFIGTFTMDSVASNPVKSLEYLKKYDLAVIVKPKEKFTDEEKLVLDQFIINGGKTLWLVDRVNMEMDSLYNETGSALAFPNDIGLDEMFFKYGFRIRPDLIKDEQATPIKLATGQEGSGTQYTQYFWKYSPFIAAPAESPNAIVKNIDGIKFDFANPIDTLKNSIKKTVLLKSSPYSKLVGTPVEVKLAMVNEESSRKEYTKPGDFPVAVLLEGKFHSMYENRVQPFTDKTFQPVGRDNKMIVISDGDVIRNQLDKNYQPLELGYDKWTSAMYGNKEFMMNCVNYLLDDNGLINIRNKDVKLPLLDKEKVYEEYTMAQAITIGLPIVILIIAGLLFTYLRKRKYSR